MNSMPFILSIKKHLTYFHFTYAQMMILTNDDDRNDDLYGSKKKKMKMQ